MLRRLLGTNFTGDNLHLLHVICNSSTRERLFFIAPRFKIFPLGSFLLKLLWHMMLWFLMPVSYLETKFNTDLQMNQNRFDWNPQLPIRHTMFSLSTIWLYSLSLLRTNWLNRRIISQSNLFKEMKMSLNKMLYAEPKMMVLHLQMILEIKYHL